MQRESLKNRVIMRSLYSFILAICLLGAPQFANAQNYVGVSGGFMDYDHDDHPSPIDVDSTGYLFFAGGQFDPLLSMEFSYTSLFDQRVNKQDSSAYVVELSVMFRSPGQGFEPFLRFGAARVDAVNEALDYDADEGGLLFGLGGDILLNFNSAVRIEYREANFGGPKSRTLAIGSLYRF